MNQWVRVHGVVERGGRRLLRHLPLFSVALIASALAIIALSQMSGVDDRRHRHRGHHRYRAPHHNLQPSTKSKNDGFRLEPLISVKAASVELSAQGVLNGLRVSVIASILDEEESFSLFFFPRHHSLKTKRMPDCPSVPPGLKGRIKVSANMTLVKRQQQLQMAQFKLPHGGAWSPPNCSSRHSVAIVIPYRDRQAQLDVLLGFLHPLLQRQQIAYRVFVVEQVGNDTFNKGAVMNAGFLTALSKSARNMPILFHCFVFHDVDLLSEDDRNLYTCPHQPRHMSVAVNELHYRLPYRQLVGGVFAIRTDHFLRVNGYSNLYWGWGGEDDDMGYRVEHVLSSISRPPEWIARYTMLKHEKRRPLAWKVRTKLTRTWRRFRVDGLNTLRYSLVSSDELPGETRLKVDVGKPPPDIARLQHEEDIKAKKN